MQQQRQQQLQQQLLHLPTEEEVNEALLTHLLKEGNEEPWREIVLQCLNYATQYQHACFRIPEQQDSAGAAVEADSSAGGTKEEGKDAGDVAMEDATPTETNDAGGTSKGAEGTNEGKINSTEEKTTTTPKSTSTPTNDPIQENIQDATSFLYQALIRYDEAQTTNNTNATTTTENDASDSMTQPTQPKESIPNKKTSCRARGVLVDAFWFLGTLLDSNNYTSAPTNNSKNKKSTGWNTKSNFQALVQVMNSMADTGTTTNNATTTTTSSSDTTTQNSPNYSTLPSSLLATTLEIPLLDQVKNIFPGNGGAQMFLKKLRKLNTDRVYRQKKVNLLQEESEGYAKLLVYLLDLSEGSEESAVATVATASTDAATVATLTNQDNGTASVMNTTNVLNTIKEWIGAFDLDPNRVLDLTLDVLEWNVQSLLKQATSKQKSSTTTVSGGRASSSIDEDVYKCFTKKSHDLTDGPIAQAIYLLLEIIRLFPTESTAHLIGFKYSSYMAPKSANGDNSKESGGTTKAITTMTTTTTTTGKPTDIPTKSPICSNDTKDVPKCLYVTTGILAAHCLLDLTMLSPHLQPNLDAIKLSYKGWRLNTMKAIHKIGIVSLNSKKTADSKKNDESTLKDEQDALNKLEQNQFIQLLYTLLQLGLQWDIIIKIFQTSNKTDDDSTKMRMTVQVEDAIVGSSCLYAPIGHALCHYIDIMIEPLCVAKVGSINMNVIQGRPQILQRSRNKTTSSTFTSSIIPANALVCNTIPTSTITLAQFAKYMANPLIPLVATGAIASDASLYCKFCRLVRVLLIEELAKNGTELEEPVYHLLETFLIPSLSLFPSNPSISSELWSILDLLPYQTRYALYASWKKNGLEKSALKQPRKPLMQIESEVKTGCDIKYLMKRVSKDNIKDMGRQISKVTHNNPLVVFTTILSQIESYDNFILMMVDTFRYMTWLSLDVMGYCLLVSLGGGDGGEARSKLKADGVNAAQWLSSLETFAGAFYKKFPDVELNGLISYIIKRLNEGHSLELGVLQALLKTAGGYGFASAESTASLNEVQLNGRKGSRLLMRETSDFGVVEKVNVISLTKLRSVLQTDDCGIVLLILLAQVRPRILFDAPQGVSKQIKLIGNFYDNCGKSFSLLLSFLIDNSDDTDEDDQGAIAKYAGSLPTLSELHNAYGIDNALAWMLCRPLIREALSKTEIPTYLTPFHPEKMQSTYRSMLPEDSWTCISTLLFERFYSYSIYDLCCPEEQYNLEITRLKREIDRLTQLQRGGKEAIGMRAQAVQAVAAAGGTDREIREASAFSRVHEQELDRVRINSNILVKNMATQKEHCDATHKTLELDKNAFFVTEEGGINENTASIFLTHCVYPRCVLSPEDALYCAEFIKTLHKLETPGFSTMMFINVFVSGIIGALYCITEEEASNLGLLLEEVWKITSAWRYDEKAFESMVEGKPGAIWRQDPNPQDSENDKNELFESEESQHYLTYEEFKVIYNRWHANLGSAFIGCLKSSEYMHNRTSLIILKRIVRQFPTKSILGVKLLDALSLLQGEDNEKEDIKVMAQACHSQIVKARDDGVWKEEDSEAAKARIERETQLQEERKKKYEKQFEEMKENSEKIGHELRTQDRGWSSARDSNRGNHRRPQMSPPPPSSDRRPVDNSGTIDHQRNNRSEESNRPASSERGETTLKDRWVKEGPTDSNRDSYQRDKKRETRSDGGSRVIGNNRNNSTTGDINTGGYAASASGESYRSLEGRFTKSTAPSSSGISSSAPAGGRLKRERSPDDDGRDLKRSRLDQRGDRRVHQNTSSNNRSDNNRRSRR